MANIGCKIISDFKRPSKELLSAFKDLPVANIDDCMNRTAALSERIRPIGRGGIVGPAFTIKVPMGDNLMLHKAMDMTQPGDVIIIDAGGCKNRAIFGELMATYMQKRGVAGIIVDGSIRDSSALAEMEDFPVYASGISPNGPYKNGPGEINVPISIGGQVVTPGDIIVGDDDGIIVIKPEIAEELLAKTKEVMKKEEKIMKKIINECSYVRPWVDEILNNIGCEIV
jgi:RraA family protein